METSDPADESLSYTLKNRVRNPLAEVDDETKFHKLGARSGTNPLM
jgi:hypothetical protein